MNHDERIAAITELGISFRSKFVPQSQSRNQGQKELSLNWVCTLLYWGKEVLDVEYVQGIGHHPNYSPKQTLFVQEEMKLGSEQGKYTPPGSSWYSKPISPPYPDDILCSLLNNYKVLDYSCFEEWANEFGYDTDSRKAESVYQACLKQSLLLRGRLGDEVMRKLDEITAGM